MSLTGKDAEHCFAQLDSLMENRLTLRRSLYPFRQQYLGLIRVENPHMTAPQHQITVIEKVLVNDLRVPVKSIRKIQAQLSTDQVMVFRIACFGHDGRDYIIREYTLLQDLIYLKLYQTKKVSFCIDIKPLCSYT